MVPKSYYLKKLKVALGFTFIEMLIVISVITILTLITIPIYQGSQRQLALQRAANKLAQDIRRVEEMAMSAREFNGAFPPGGYGVYFNLNEPDHYILFADASTSAPNYSYDGGELVEDVFFETGSEVQINQLSPSSPLTITFTPPDPTTRVNTNPSSAVIILKIGDSTTSVKVLPTGLIYVE